MVFYTHTLSPDARQQSSEQSKSSAQLRNPSLVIGVCHVPSSSLYFHNNLIVYRRQQRRVGSQRCLVSQMISCLSSPTEPKMCWWWLCHATSCAAHITPGQSYWPDQQACSALCSVCTPANKMVPTGKPCRATSQWAKRTSRYHWRKDQHCSQQAWNIM